MDNSTAKQTFGSAIARWFRQNDWPQKICERWSECDGRGIKGPWASQISQVVHGRLDPRTIFFDALGDFNHAVAEQDLTRIQQVDQELYERLAAGKPFLLDDRQPATATDFFSMFVGEMLVPDFYRGNEFTDADVEALFRGCGQMLEYVCMETYLSRPEVIQILDDEVLSKRGEFGALVKRAFLDLGWPTLKDIQTAIAKGELVPELGCCCVDVFERLLRQAQKPIDALEEYRAVSIEQFLLIKSL